MNTSIDETVWTVYSILHLIHEYYCKQKYIGRRTEFKIKDTIFFTSEWQQNKFLDKFVFPFYEDRYHLMSSPINK